MMAVRRLGDEEIPLARALLEPEGWSLEPHELARLYGLGGAVGAFEGDRLVGFCTFVDTPPYRWVGNVAVHPTKRGKGVGMRVVGEALRGAERAALYSVEKAVTLYARLQLVPSGGVVLSMRAERATPLARGSDVLAPADVDEVLALDRLVTGMDRERLLRALIEPYPARVIRRDGRVVGFGIAKTYSGVTEVGPAVALRADDGWAIVDDLLRETESPHDVAVHAPSRAAAAERGFEPAFRAIPMFRGGAPSWDLERYHVAAGLEKG